MIETLISFVLATITLAISPGPDNIFVLTESIVNGKKQALITVAGLMTGCIVHTTFVAFGVSEIIKKNQNIFFIIKLFGACYLLYLAYKVYKADDKIVINTGIINKKPVKELFINGFWMNVLNPKVTIFFLAFLPQFLFSNTLPSVLQFYVLGFIFIITSCIVFSLIAISAASISNKIKQNNTIGYYLKWLQIVVFVLIAMFIFF